MKVYIFALLLLQAFNFETCMAASASLNTYGSCRPGYYTTCPDGSSKKSTESVTDQLKNAQNKKRGDVDKARKAPSFSPITDFGKHIRCLLQEKDSIPVRCREFIETTARCLKEIDYFCPRRTEEATLKCLVSNERELGERCRSSLFLRLELEKSGKDTASYRNAYRQQASEFREYAKLAAEEEKEMMRNIMSGGSRPSGGGDGSPIHGLATKKGPGLGRTRRVRFDDEQDEL